MDNKLEPSTSSGTTTRLTLTNANILNNNLTPITNLNANTPSTSMSGATSSNSNSSIYQSVLFVNVKELNLKLYNEIIVSWNILEETSNLDWIGIYKISINRFNP